MLDGAGHLRFLWKVVLPLSRPALVAAGLLTFLASWNAFLWPLIVAHQWETALMKYRISTDYQQPDGPPKWEFQDNIVLIPKNIVEKTRAFAGPRIG